jgi:type II restriction enzyme
MRRGVLELNTRHRELLSNDLGALAGLLFDVGAGRYNAPPREDDMGAVAVWEADLARVREEAVRNRAQLDEGRRGDRTHTEVQGWLKDLGRALGFDVWVAANDHNRPYGAGRLCDGCVAALPVELERSPGGEAVRLIDVLWLARGSGTVAAAFEVEHTTSIYSGIVRLLDLALGDAERHLSGLFLVAPDAREDDVRTQLTRPAFARVRDLKVRFLPYSELEKHRDAMGRFGEGLKAIDAVARVL